MKNEADGIRIRHFENRDIDAVAKIIAQSFGGKFGRMTNLSGDPLANLLRDAEFVYDRPAKGYMVGEKEGRVVGVMLLKWKGQNRDNERRLSFSALCRVYGFLNVVRLKLGAAIFHEDVADDEGYIEHVAVSPEARGLGIGKRMIDYGNEILRKNPAIYRYTLYVADGNQGAIRLYQRLGFETKKTIQSMITRCLFGVGRWHYMVKTIRQARR